MIYTFSSMAIPAVKNRPLISPMHQPRSYHAALAASLIWYAKHDQQFAEKLRSLTFSLPYRGLTRSQPWVGIELLVPTDSAMALRRATWLHDAIINHRFDDIEQAAALLVSWAQPRTYPSAQPLVVGIVGLAIPGITLGLIKRHVTMVLVVRKGFSSSSPDRFAELSAQASLGALSRAITAAEGDLHQLEPEIGEWFFGNRDLSFYQAPSATLTILEAELDRFGVTHSAVTDGSETALLAISPVVNRFYCRERWQLQPLRQ